jgi:hypothetical protein
MFHLDDALVLDQLLEVNSNIFNVTVINIFFL